MRAQSTDLFLILGVFMRIQDYLQKRFSRVGDFYSPET